MTFRRIITNMFWGSLGALFGFSLIAIFYFSPHIQIRPGRESVYSAPVLSASVERAEPRDEYSLLFVGDIMMDRGIRKMVDLHGNGEYTFPFQYVRDFLLSPDVTFANLEGPISDLGTRHGSIYSFRMDPAVAHVLSEAGVDIVSVANNHMGDYGREAFEDTVRLLGAAGVEYTGGGWDREDAKTPRVILRGGRRIGFLGLTDVGPGWLAAGSTTSGLLIADTQKVRDYIRQAKEKVDILVVSFHFGEEYRTSSTGRQEELAHAAIDAGAKIVVGHHPHVAEEVEEYRGGVIAYSLGNFIFDQAFSPDTQKALALVVHMKGVNIDHIEKKKIIFNEYFQPKLAEG